MPFDYYYRLSEHLRRVYRESDEYGSIELTEHGPLRVLASHIDTALQQESRTQIQSACDALAAAACDDLNVWPPRVIVREQRPADDYEELHGLYDPEEDPAVITVWMRTAKRDQVVAFRTFVRTLLHELCHHLDYELLELDDSLHTEGFFLRESSLFDQLVR